MNHECIVFLPVKVGVVEQVAGPAAAAVHLTATAQYPNECTTKYDNDDKVQSGETQHRREHGTEQRSLAQA